MLLKDFKNIKTFFPPCHPGEVESVAATADAKEDISEVFPYLNALMKGTIFDQKNMTLNFKLGGHGITLHKNKVVVTRCENEEDAIKVLGGLKNLINRTYERRDRIEPSYKTRAQLSVLDVYKVLPRINCGECGEPACMGFAAKLIAEETKIERCKPLFTEEYAESRKKLFELLDEAGYPVPKI